LRSQARLELLAGGVGSAPQLGAQAREARLGEGVQQCLTIGEVAPWRAVADAGLACKLAQRQALDAPLAHAAFGLGQQLGPKVSVVIGARSHLPSAYRTM
jgi:hypothetical protein